MDIYVGVIGPKWSRDSLNQTVTNVLLSITFYLK